MMIVLRGVTREAAEAILAGERPGDARVADDYPTEFSEGLARRRARSDSSVRSSSTAPRTTWSSARSVRPSSTTRGLEIGYAVVESQRYRGYATAAVEELVTKARQASEVRRIVAHTPLDRPQSGRVVERAGFAMLRETDDMDEVGNVLRVKEWELTL